MIRNVSTLLACSLPLLLCACVWHGSDRGSLALWGTVVTDAETPLSGVTLIFQLPRTYGLERTGESRATPKDFEQGRVAQGLTDQSGSFHVLFPDIIFRSNFWLLPPLGPLPRRPPPPLVLVRSPSLDDEVYMVDTAKGRFRIWDPDGIEEDPSGAVLAGLTAGSEPDRSAGIRTAGMIHMIFRDATPFPGGPDRFDPASD